MTRSDEEWDVELTFVRRTVIRYRVSATDDETAVMKARDLASESKLTPPAHGKVIDDKLVTDRYHARLIEDE